MTSSAVARYSANTDGRDFIVGDIHGEFVALKQKLDEVSFSPNRDRLFSVGDLVDRGENSAVAIEWLDQPWFHAVLGNHESMCLDSAESEEAFQMWVAGNGGSWWLDVDEATRERFVNGFKQLPLVIEIQRPGERIGIVHADVPASLSWDEFLDQIEVDDRLRKHALWARSRIASNKAKHRGMVKGVDRIYCGHTPLQRPAVIGNVYCIDTGACYEGGTLTVISLDA